MLMLKAVAVEALLVALLGVGLALVANAISPRGLGLNRNYFPVGTQVSPAGAGVDRREATAADPADAVRNRLVRRGLGLATGPEVAAWFRDPQFAQGLVVMIDARDDASYRSGHIPGAWQFNHYRPEQHLPMVLPVCLNALKVVVYCTGGSCEDSEFAAVMLRDGGVPRENLFIYPGGIAEWKARSLPIEIGSRLSGQLLPPAP